MKFRMNNENSKFEQDFFWGWNSTLKNLFDGLFTSLSNPTPCFLAIVFLSTLLYSDLRLNDGDDILPATTAG